MRFAGVRTVLVLAVGTWLGGAAIVATEQAAPRDPRVPPTENAPTFTKDVAPILYKNCVACHRLGEIGPMSLLSYRDVRPWAKSIREKVAAGAMPPWFADPDGTIEYQYFEVPTHFKEDKWIQAAEVRVGDREHVHHSIVSVIEPEKSNRPTVMEVKAIVAQGQPSAPPRQPTEAQRAQFARASRRAGANMLLNYAVGEDAPMYPTGMAKRIPAGSTLVFQMHYVTNGAPGKDRTKIGLIFAKQPPPKEIRTGMIVNAQFAIPPGAGEYQIEAEASFTDNVKIYTMHPHMHLRGKDMTFTATYPDGKSEIVLRVPRFDFGWQSDYWLAEPITLPKGSKLHVTAHFDNSSANPNNPDPKATVRWGDQTWEEMMIGFFTYTVESGSATPTAGKP